MVTVLRLDDERFPDVADIFPAGTGCSALRTISWG